MAKCERSSDFGFRLWPPFSAAAFRRRLLYALMCGVSSHRRKTVLASPHRRPKQRSERLAELLKAEPSDNSCSDEPSETESEARKKLEAFEELQRAVKHLQAEDDLDRRKEGAIAIRKLAKDDADARETLAMLGAIPPLVGSLDCSDPETHIASLYALLNLSIANDMNKAAVVTAGAVHKMLRLMDLGCSHEVSDAIVANFLGLSALDSNKPLIGSSGAIPFLVAAFQSSSTSAQARHDALRAIFNLSISQSNAQKLIDSGLVETLLRTISDDAEFTERSLMVLSNLVSSPEGRRGISRLPDAISILVDVLSWLDAPGCQEKAVYILMIMAHRCYGDRTAMAEAGATSSLLELTLMGTALAQKRASRLLEILRVDNFKGKQVTEDFTSGAAAVTSTMSAPQCGETEVEEGNGEMSKERKEVKKLVQQSLQNNMQRIARRANLPQSFAPSERLKALTSGNTSKSLPF